MNKANSEREPFAPLRSISDAESGNTISVVAIDQKLHWLNIASATLFGISQLLIWNNVINMYGIFAGPFWPSEVFPDLLGGVEHGAALIVSLIFMRFNGLNIRLAYLASVVNTITFLLLPMVPQFFHGSEHASTAKGLLCLVCGLLGCCSGMFHVCGYGFASIWEHTNYSGYVSMGNGIAGVYSWGCFEILNNSGFGVDVDGQLKMTWVFFALGALISALQLAVFWPISHNAEFKRRVKYAIAARETRRMERSGMSYKDRLLICRKVWRPVFSISFTLFLTLNLFPVVGPFGWNLGNEWNTGLQGVFQITDFLARYLGNLGGIFNLSEKGCFIMSIARLVFIPLFVIPQRVMKSGFMGASWWLSIVMLTFTVSNGWVNTKAAIYSTSSLPDVGENEIASEFFVFNILLWITVSIFFSKIYVL